MKIVKRLLYAAAGLVAVLLVIGLFLPEQVQAAFDDAVKAGQHRDRQVNEGQAYANDVIPRARGTASRLIEEANGYKGRVIANAEGEASRFRQILAEYSKAPEVTRQRMYIETVQQMLANSSKIMLDAKGSGNLLYLPLDKLMQAAATALAAAATSDSAGVPQRTALNLSAEVPPQHDAATRSREALSSRERGER